MFLNNLMDDRQTESRSFVFSALVFRREKRVEDVFEIRILDSFTGILDLDVGPDFSLPASPACGSERVSVHPLQPSSPWH